MSAALGGGGGDGRSVSGRSMGVGSFREILMATEDVFNQSRREEEEEDLRLAAIERLPTYGQLRKGILTTQALDNGKGVYDEVDVKRLGFQDKEEVMEKILQILKEDNESFLQRLRDRFQQVDIDIPKIEVRYEHLSVEGEVFVGSRALPTLLNSTINVLEGAMGLVGLAPSKKRKITILQDVSGILKPSRMTLLLGPPAVGKTTLLLALAGKLDPDLRVSGKVTYCGHELSEFVPQRTCAYVSQHDLHNGEMTVRETLDFAGRCLGIGGRHELVAELLRRDKGTGFKPDPEIDVFLKSIALLGQKTTFITDCILQILGLDICADTFVGNAMRRGISGGQKKRLTTGEMLAGPAKVFFMDEISNGLDSSTTFQIVKYLRQLAHIVDVTMVISLLQPAPETYNLFDDVILLSEGQVVYHGPRKDILEFFECVGFKCPHRKGVADFLQEVTSKKDQEQYWFRKDQPFQYVTVPEFVRAFGSFRVGKQLSSELGVPFDKSRTHPAALVKEKYGISNWELFKACFAREWQLMKRNNFVYIFKICQITIMSLICMTVFLRTEMHHDSVADGGKYLGALFFSLMNVMFNGVTELAMTVFRLPVFYKQRDSLFYPAWAFALPIWVLRIPISFVESGIWIILTYYTVGFAPTANRFLLQFLVFFCVHQMALSLFRFIAALGRTEIVANMLGIFSLLFTLLLGGFVIAKNDIQPWMIWGYYMSPMMYGQNAIVMNEFLDQRWTNPNTDRRFNEPTIGRVILSSRGFFTDDYWFWICVGALIGYSFLFNILFIAALTYLNSLGETKNVFREENDDKKNHSSPWKQETVSLDGNHEPRKGMLLPFQPLSIAFSHVNYYVDMPTEMKNHGAEEDRLQLLRDVSGAFRPGILTALVGVSGAGKTTLMDVLAGRKTGGYSDGSISISGYSKNQATFARISGYCEQNDIHSPHVTVYESLVYSAWLRLSHDSNTQTQKMFVEEVMELVELKPLRNALVGLPGVDGLSTDQRKRLTIAVELVANPSIIFMDEPTSGLDARAAAIVMRTVRNTVDTGRTVVCTIHQPSIDIFEAFDELLLMKRGGQVIYSGPLGHNSNKLVEYFEAVEGIPKIRDGYNPATWMLEVTGPSVEAQLNVDFVQIYSNSALYQENQKLIKELSTPEPGSEDLSFPTKYSQPFLTQCKACLWKQHWSYWRNPPYVATRFFMTVMVGVFFGVIFWNKGQQTTKEQDLTNLLGAMYSAVVFLGTTNTSAVQPVVAIERIVFYRERAAGMYSAMPYAVGQVAVEAMHIALQTIVYTLILYSMIGFEWQWAKFFQFYYYILMCFMYFTMYGMMLVALTPNHQIAAIVMSFFVGIWNLFSGFLILKPQIPVWWTWYYWCSPVAWTIYGLITSQFGDKTMDLVIPGAGNMSVKGFLKDALGYDHDFLLAVAAAHIGWVVLFFCVFAYGIKFFNFQKR